MFTLALVQMKVEGGRLQENLERACEWIGRAASQGAQVVLLPEALNLGWTHSSARDQADPIPEGFSCRRLRQAARRHRVFVCAGLVEWAEEVFNSALLIDPQGQILLHHRKINELEIAHSLYAAGRQLAVAATPLAHFGVLICADAFARGQVLSRALGYLGADVILSPCAWAVPPDHDPLQEPYGDLWRQCYRPVARDFRLWIAGASQVGRIEEGAWKGWNCIGSSLVIDPQGREVLQGPYGADVETLLLVEIRPQPRPARGTLWEALWKETLAEEKE